ncbi:MAG: hypothetical protein MUF38_07815 [Anaerolineae bacterium]|nr:hypothetical protein [Anaerolineae bacterium]
MPSSLPHPQPPPDYNKRGVKAVPFVELHDGRVQGVVSSGSDIERVYVSYFEAGTMHYYCSTNNNRPCGGLGSSPCKHLTLMMGEAITEYGVDTVARFLKLPPDEANSFVGILKQAKGMSKSPAGEVFSRFLAYLQLLEYPSSNQPVAEMDWFVG